MTTQGGGTVSGAEPDHFAAAKEWAPVVLFSLLGLGALQLYANYLRRIPGPDYIRPGFFRSRSLYGRVTSVGDGDNFHLFHTPGGRVAGWGWLRKVPETRAGLKDRTHSRYRSASRASTRRRERISAGWRSRLPPRR